MNHFDPMAGVKDVYVTRHAGMPAVMVVPEAADGICTMYQPDIPGYGFWRAEALRRRPEWPSYAEQEGF